MPLSRGPIRARDLRANVKELGFEEGTLMTLELLLDERAPERQHMRELTDLVSHCIELVHQLSIVGEGLQTRINQIKRDQTGEADLDNR